MARHKRKSHSTRKASKRKVNVAARSKHCKGLSKGAFRKCQKTGKRPSRR